MIISIIVIIIFLFFFLSLFLKVATVNIKAHAPSFVSVLKSNKHLEIYIKGLSVVTFPFISSAFKKEKTEDFV